LSGEAPAGRQAGVTILLSTYNGARFLPEQLESLRAQAFENWVLYWRDDGSSDESVAIMRDFAVRIGPERCIESPGSGPHLGAAHSFLTLLAERRDSGAVAFADQDDVWLPDKLRQAMDALAAEGAAPALYCARQYLVDAGLRGARLSAAPREAPGFPASLAQNIATGNTLVMNAAAAQLVARMGRPEGSMHDWWSYITVSACGGRILFDPLPQVLYRQHKDNLIGSTRPLPARALAALRRGPGRFMSVMRRHADLLAAQSGLLAPQARRELSAIHAGLQGGLRLRLRALRCRRFRRRALLENLLFGYWFLADGMAMAPPPRAQGQGARPIAPEVRL